jgi:DNA-binding IscR family transcriptional regulator
MSRPPGGPGGGVEEVGRVEQGTVAWATAEAGRAAVLAGLVDGRSLPRSVLAGEVGLTPAVTARHLGDLCEAGVVSATVRGRFAYYRLARPAGTAVAEAAARAFDPPVRSLRPGTDAYAVRRARFCYGHLAGRAGVAVTDALRSRGYLAGHDGGVDLDRLGGPRPAGGVLDPVGYTVTPAGRAALTGLGVAVPDDDEARCCVDWTEQRHHLAGPIGKALAEAFVVRGWVVRGRVPRSAEVTAAGRAGLRRALGVEAP